MPRIGTTDLDVFGLNLGGNVFGWTADEQESFAVLDAYAGAGGNFIDTADSYSAWLPGHVGGESETIIGRWLARRSTRDDVVIATKVGSLPTAKGLKAANIKKAAEDSLKRLGTDHIDLYYAHRDDPGTPVEETVAAFGELVKEGKVRYVAASNYTPERLALALQAADELGVARFAALQPHYNLVERSAYEGALAELAARENLGVLPYYALAAGFLTGKYRDAEDQGSSPRGTQAVKYLNTPTGRRVLASLDDVASAHGTSVTSVALAWLASRPQVVAPIASARTVEQLPDLLASVDLALTAEELDELTKASVDEG